MGLAADRREAGSGNGGGGRGGSRNDPAEESLLFGFSRRGFVTILENGSGFGVIDAIRRSNPVGEGFGETREEGEGE